VILMSGASNMFNWLYSGSFCLGEGYSYSRGYVFSRL
jgi:hypothetical protein